MEKITEWRVIPGFVRYSVSSDGEVRRDSRMHNTLAGLVAQRIDSHGYLSCNLMSDAGGQKKLQVHTLIAGAFLGPRPEGLVVCHGKEGQMVNRASNLRYDTQASNIEDMRVAGTMLCGSKHPTSKLDESKVLQILALLLEKRLTHKQIGALFEVDGACIGRIALGKTWRHVKRPTDLPRRYAVSRSRQKGAA